MRERKGGRERREKRREREAKNCTHSCDKWTTCISWKCLLNTHNKKKQLMENGRKKNCKNSQDFLTPNLFCASTKIAHTGCCYLISTVDPALNTNKLSSPSFMPLSYNQWFFSRAFWGGNKSPPKQRQIFLVFLDVFHIFSPHKSNLEKKAGYNCNITRAGSADLP